MATNAGYDGHAVIEQVLGMPPGHGLNALTGEVGDRFEDGVIDPLRVTWATIEHAASVAALMLTTEALVAQELIAQPGAIIAPGFGDLAEGLARAASLRNLLRPAGGEGPDAGGLLGLTAERRHEPLDPPQLVG